MSLATVMPGRCITESQYTYPDSITTDSTKRTKHELPKECYVLDMERSSAHVLPILVSRPALPRTSLSLERDSERSGVWEQQNKPLRVKSRVQAGGLCSAIRTAFSMFCSRRFSLAILKILWIAHLWQIKGPGFGFFFFFNLHISSLFTTGFL